MVNEFITNNKEWNSLLFAEVMDSIDIGVITNTLIPRRVEVEDTPCWTANSNGKFYAKTAYDRLANIGNTDDNWNWIWQLKVSAKLQGFLWTCMHGKILTNQHRKLRGLIDCDLCLRCDTAVEDLKHLFFDCPTSANLWLRLPKFQVLTIGDLNAWRTWINTNIRLKHAKSGGFFNSVLALTFLWNIWIMRNKKVFDNINPNPAFVYLNCLKFATEITELFVPHTRSSTKSLKLISWNFPGTGKFKLNTDGSNRGTVE